MRADSSGNDATAPIRTALLPTPQLLRLPQVQQHIVQQQLIARFLLAQSSDEAEHVKLVGRVFALFHVVSMGVIADAVCQAWLTAFVGEYRRDL